MFCRGKLVYQGRPDELTPYIKDVLGREVPVNENSVDYFLDIIKEFEQSKAGLDQLVQWQRPDDGSLSFTPKTRVKFGTLFAKSAEGEDSVPLLNTYLNVLFCVNIARLFGLVLSGCVHLTLPFHLRLVKN